MFSCKIKINIKSLFIIIGNRLYEFINIIRLLLLLIDLISINSHHFIELIAEDKSLEEIEYILCYIKIVKYHTTINETTAKTIEIKFHNKARRE
jgi:hypothetical protein